MKHWNNIVTDSAISALIEKLPAQTSNLSLNVKWPQITISEVVESIKPVCEKSG